jgi:ABC-type tungstate transport system substrate-binding protein
VAGEISLVFVEIGISVSIGGGMVYDCWRLTSALNPESEGGNVDEIEGYETG